MSILIKLKGEWDDCIDCKRDSVVENVVSLLSSRAPVWRNPNLRAGIANVEDVSDRVHGSIACYGMKRVLCAPGKPHIEEFLEEIRELINTFEPRYQDVTVTLDETKKHANMLHFRIEGVIAGFESDERMVLESTLDLTTSYLNVRKTNLDFF